MWQPRRNTARLPLYGAVARDYSCSFIPLGRNVEKFGVPDIPNPAPDRNAAILLVYSEQAAPFRPRPHSAKQQFKQFGSAVTMVVFSFPHHERVNAVGPHRPVEFERWFLADSFVRITAEIVEALNPGFRSLLHYLPELPWNRI
jgi:hypothetical protein